MTFNIVSCPHAHNLYFVISLELVPISVKELVRTDLRWKAEFFVQLCGTHIQLAADLNLGLSNLYVIYLYLYNVSPGMIMHRKVRLIEIGIRYDKILRIRLVAIYN